MRMAMEPQAQQQLEEEGGERWQVGLLVGLRLVCCDSVGCAVVGVNRGCTRPGPIEWKDHNPPTGLFEAD